MSFLPQGPSITVGEGSTSITFVDLPGLIILKTRVGTLARNSSFFRQFRDGTAPAVYTVTNTFVMHAFEIEQTDTAPAAGGFDGFLTFSDADVGEDSAAALTNPVGMMSAVAGIGAQKDALITQAAPLGDDRYKSGVHYGRAPVGKILHIRFATIAGCSCTLYGFEV